MTALTTLQRQKIPLELRDLDLVIDLPNMKFTNFVNKWDVDKLFITPHVRYLSLGNHLKKNLLQVFDWGPYLTVAIGHRGTVLEEIRAKQFVELCSEEKIKALAWLERKSVYRPGTRSFRVYYDEYSPIVENGDTFGTDGKTNIEVFEDLKYVDAKLLFSMFPVLLDVIDPDKAFEAAFSRM